ncbi:FixH protein [Paenimyroides aquimaris]|uniref:FixH protein n=1 Tax=Paenimyroides marinum TaxID=1159016 RepID=A0A1H6K533_9FLAO|nr:FixH family protein [Paenimyroides aquimaris]SEH66887.1 FixH protein [Paenimyroides aquimaris]
MKFNWGTGIVIGIISFMVFILQYVIRVQVDPQYDNELVTENYYQKELEVNSNFVQKQNALSLTGLDIKTTQKGIEIYFPEAFKAQDIKGNISLYRPSNQALDQTFPLNLSSNYLLIPKSRLVDGRWDISLNFSYKDTTYLKEQTLVL